MRSRLPCRTVLATMLLLTTLLPHGLARADQESPPPNVVGGHWFQPSLIVPTPFVGSQATLGFGLGLADLERRLFEGTGLDIRRNIQVGAFSPVVEGDIEVMPRLQLLLGFTGYAITGLNTESALIFGASTAYGLRTGLDYALLEHGKTRLTLGLGVGWDKTYAVSPLFNAASAVRGAIGDSPASSEPRGDVVNWRPSLRFAYGLSETFGILATTRLRLLGGENPARESTEGTRLFVSFGGDLNLDPAIGVPIALTGNFQRNLNLSEDGSGNTSGLIFGIFQSLTARFNFGAELAFASSGNQEAQLFTMVSKYWF